MIDDVGEIALGGLRDDVGGARPVPRPCACRAARRAGRKSRARPRRAASRTRRYRARRRRRRCSRIRARRRSSAEKRSSTSVSRPPAASTRSEAAARSRSGRGRCRCTRQSAAARMARRIAAGAEGAVDIDAAGAHVERFERLPREHGNVAGRSASDSRAVAARHHSRAPSGASAALSSRPHCAQCRHAAPGSAAEADRLPDWKCCRERGHRRRPSMGYARLEMFG